MDEVIGTTLFTAATFLEKPENYVIITPSLYSAQRIVSFLSTFMDEKYILYYPNDDLLQLEIISSSRELEAQRLYTLAKLQNKDEKHIIVTNVTGALRHTVSKENFKNHILTLQKGHEYTLNSLIEKLVFMGYQRVNKVDQSLQFAVRGDIVDIFSLNNEKPIRLEFFGDELESIRFFDIGQQTSISILENITIIPASEILLDNLQIEQLTKNILKQKDRQIANLTTEEAQKLTNNIDNDLYLLNERSSTARLYKYFCLSPIFNYTLFDHIQSPHLIYANKTQITTSHQTLWQETSNFLYELSSQHKTISGLEYFSDFAKVVSKSKNHTIIEEFSTSPNDIYVHINPIQFVFPKLDDFINDIKKNLFNSKKIVVSINNEAQKKQIEEALSLRNIGFVFDEYVPDYVSLTYNYFPHGFELNEEKTVIYTSKEIFNIKKNSARTSSRFKNGQIINSYEQLNPGDFVVHEYHGIGQFADVVTLFDEGIHRDFLKISYAGSDVLYVPLEQFQLVRKYSGREGAAPRLNKLNSGEWEKTKKRINTKIKEIADQLLKTQAERKQNKGFAYPHDDEIQVEFENRFEYPLTIDQQQAVQEIKEDMEKDEPMDRLLCGDVGFGKTEVAFRAAFKAISAGKQVALLCPTTLLARQHFELAKQRFADFGIRISALSRLIPESVQKKVIEDVNNGKIDLLIGTHRILTKELKYKDLGLLIVDEEQRFGVEQKEKIKQYKAVIDVLTLSATPIPRTLQMSLVGMRSLSQINTAPSERMPIQTYVIPKKNDVIKLLIERELQRDGQVFYLHNRVDSIYQVATRLSKLVKDSYVGVVHGQMDKDEVEDVMIKFYAGEINVLVCTTIIENGIDVPNANMIIIENAASFGLGQLYQIKGRVGRGDRPGYAYLTYNEDGNITDDGKKRLKAIQEFTELGSGYKIAQRDLMIRGAGDLLGPEQAGFIDSVGIDLYLKMLARAIKTNNAELVEEEPPKPTKMLDIDAYIPDKYAQKPDKIVLYQEIKDVKTLKDLKELEIKTNDIYGKMPDEVVTFFKKKRLDLIIDAKVKFIQNIYDQPTFIDVTPGYTFFLVEGSINKLMARISDISDDIKILPFEGKIRIRINKNKNWFDIYDKVINSIAAVVMGYVKERNEN